MFNLVKNLVRNFGELVGKSFKLIERLNMYWNSIITKPTLNSIADKIKKKNVNESRFVLFRVYPKIATIA